MRRRTALLGLLLPLLLLPASCSRRDRGNPLDSANPNSGGAPTGFNALADYVRVNLVWSARTDLAIDGFQLFRLAPLDNVYRPLGGVLPASSSQYTDDTTTNGLDYRYRLYFVVGGALSPRFAEDVATPGRVRAWVVDAAGGRLLRLTPDGRDVLIARGGFGSPTSLAVTPDFGPLWVADDFDRVVRVVNPANFATTLIAGIPRPFTMALDPVDASAWICDLQGSVRHYGANGLPATPNSLTLLATPSGTATHAGTGELWVCENSGNRVRVYQRDGVPLAARTLSLPSRVAVDSASAQGWVTSLSTGWVWCVTNNGVVLDSLQMRGPIGVALDWRRRTAWIADAVAGEVVAIDMDTRTVRFRVGGLGEPRDVAVDLERGDVWVVGRSAGRVYRFSATGTLLSQVGGLGEPYEVRLDRGLL
jgi:DNA-binding beta-propeller fold protein YncE